MKKKIAIFHWGQITIHAFYLAQQLNNDHVSVDFFLYTPTYANKSLHLKRLIEKLKNTVNVIEIKCTYLETYIIKVHRIIALVGPYLPALFTNPFLPFRTRKKFINQHYEFLITIAQSSLYWLFRTDRSSLKKNLHYSLEVEKITDPNLKNCHREQAIIKKETWLLKFVHGLIIQDKLRAKAFLNTQVLASNIKLIYFPVSIPGDIIKTKSNFLHKKFNITNEKYIVLYFGAVFQERKIDELVNAFEMTCDNRFVLIVHGPEDFSHIPCSDKVKTSNYLLDYEDLSSIICSAMIGLAFYDNGWPNTRLTAFSSEKIARYLQAGVPFIAFANESYLILKTEFKCCELVKDINELQSAFNIIMNDYDSYRINCYNAYQKYYNIENTIKPLVAYINKTESHQFDNVV